MFLNVDKLPRNGKESFGDCSEWRTDSDNVVHEVITEEVQVVALRIVFDLPLGHLDRRRPGSFQAVCLHVFL